MKVRTMQEPQLRVHKPERSSEQSSKWFLKPRVRIAGVFRWGMGNAAPKANNDFLVSQE